MSSPNLPPLNSRRERYPNSCPLMDAMDAEQTRTISSITWAGMLLNLLLSALKMLAGVFGHSQAVIADGVHSLSDCITDVAILIGVRYWKQPADENHPYGHGRIETMVSLSIGVILAGVAIALGLRGFRSINLVPPIAPEWVAFAATLVSIVLKEALYRWNIRVGRRIKSTALTANAWHHRSDALSSLPAALAVLATRFHPEWTFLDPIAAIIVALFIIQAAWSIIGPAFGQLIDQSAPEKDRKSIREITEQVKGVRNVHKIRTRYSGSSLEVDLHIRVDATLSVREGHDIATLVRRALLQNGPDVIEAVVHVEPDEPDV